MNKILVIFKTDSDSSLVHPITKEKLNSDCGDYYLFVSNKEEFIHSLLTNKFEISEKVYSSLLNYLEFPESSGLLNLENSYHCFGNYSIDIIYNFTDI